MNAAFFANLRSNNVFSNRDESLLALHMLRTDLTNPAQSIDTTAFATSYGVSDEQLLSYLRYYEQRGQLSIASSTSVTLTWADPAITSPFTQQQLLQQGTMDSDTTSLYALMLNKAPGVATQSVTANQFAVAPFEIPATTLLRDIVALANNDRNGIGAYFSIDLPTVNVTWLESPIAVA